MDFFLILTLILFNGFFAMAEIAVVSSRKSKLKNIELGGNPNGKIALRLAEKPNIFLSSIQVGITLITILTGALSEDRFVSKLSSIIKQLPLIGVFHTELSFIVVIISLTYLSVILGELVPKRIALSNPERIATLTAPFMSFFTRMTLPIVQLFSTSTEAIFKFIGLRSPSSSHITEDEVRILIREGADMGIFSKTEKKLIERALMLDELKVGMLMTPKHRMSVIHIDKFLADPKTYLYNYPHSRLILSEGKSDKIFGVIHLKDLLFYSFENMFDLNQLRKISDKPHMVPESMKAIKVLEMFRHSRVHLALVVDEFGTIQGLVTLNDILEALVGDIKAQTSQDIPIVIREDGSLIVDGAVSIHDLKKKLRLHDIKESDLGAYQTTAGFIIAHLEKIPQTGDYFERSGYRFEVIDMDNNRVDKIMIKKIIPK